jgi:hypothetical protein
MSLQRGFLRKEIVSNFTLKGLLYSIKTPGKNPPSLGNTEEIAMFVSEAGGKVINAESAAALPRAFNEVIANLKHSYTLGFYPSDSEANGNFHKLKVKLNSRIKCTDCSVQARSGYYLGGSTIATSEDKTQLPRAQAPRPINNIQVAPMAITMEQFYDRVFDPRALESRVRILLSDSEKNDGFRRSFAPSAGVINFRAAANKSIDAKGKQNVKIDLKIEAASLFFVFSDELYQARFAVIIFINEKSDPLCRIYKTSIPNEQFQLSHSEIALSMTIPAPSAKKDIKVIVFDPLLRSHSIQTVKIQPKG